jgi:hypothetical protein
MCFARKSVASQQPKENEVFVHDFRRVIGNLPYDWR